MFYTNKKFYLFFLLGLFCFGFLIWYFASNTSVSQPRKLIENLQPAKTGSILPTGNDYRLDIKSSRIQWKGSKLIGDSLTGEVYFDEGFLGVSDGQLSSGSFSVDLNSIKSTSLDSDDSKARLEEHLKSDDFFSVDSYPTASFSISDLSLKTDNYYQITGNLTIKGISNTISFPAKVMIDESEVKAWAEFEIDRTWWGIQYGSGKFFANLGDRAIKDEIGFMVYLKADKFDN